MEAQVQSSSHHNTVKKPECLAEQSLLSDMLVYCNLNAIPAASVLHILLKAGYVFTNHMSIILDKKFDSSNFQNYFAQHILPYVMFLRNTQDWVSERLVLFEHMETYFHEGIKEKKIREPSFLQSAIDYSKSYYDANSSIQVKKEITME